MVVGHVMDSMDHTTYLPTVKGVSVRLMLLIAVNNGLGLILGKIGNVFCTSPCAENISSCCGAEFGPGCGAVVFLKRIVYGLNMASKSFHKYVCDFLRDLRFTPSRADHYLWIHKYE